MKSMTAFARQEQVTQEGRLTLEIRSVNSRYLDLNWRLPEDFRALEMPWRATLQKRLARGKVDIGLRFSAETRVDDAVQLNEPLLRSLIEHSHAVEDWMNNPARVSALDVMRWPGAVQERRVDTRQLQEQAKALMAAALDELIANREREGAAIAGMLRERLQTIEALVRQVQERRPQVMASIRERLRGKLDELPVKVDETRLEQELVLYAQKLDVDEELDRLLTHVQEMTQVLARDEPIGRRLDFLMQEFNREANTLSSKSADVETTQAAVDMKVLIEQMREQIQNIE